MKHYRGRSIVKVIYPYIYLTYLNLELMNIVKIEPCKECGSNRGQLMELKTTVADCIKCGHLCDVDTVVYEYDEAVNDIIECHVAHQAEQRELTEWEEQQLLDYGYVKYKPKNK